MSRRLPPCVVLWLVTLLPACRDRQEPAKGGTDKAGLTIQVSAPGQRAVTHRLALRATYSERARPLPALGPKAGGIFLAYPRARALGVDLSTARSKVDVVLLDEDQRVIRVARGPRDGPSRVTAIPALYQYALVLPQGKAKTLHLKKGAAVSFSLPARARPRAVLTPVTLSPPGRSAITVHAEVALTEAERTMGLMWRTRLPAKGGMLFRFDHSQPLTFWMKNTKISLDMIFIDDGRRVTGVVHRARPLDESLYSPGPMANRYVLEVRAGFARRHGIRAGTVVTFRLPDE